MKALDNRFYVKFMQLKIAGTCHSIEKLSLPENRESISKFMFYDSTI